MFNSLFLYLLLRLRRINYKLQYPRLRYPDLCPHKYTKPVLFCFLQSFLRRYHRLLAEIVVRHTTHMKIQIIRCSYPNLPKYLVCLQTFTNESSVLKSFNCGVSPSTYVVRSKTPAATYFKIMNVVCD